MIILNSETEYSKALKRADEIFNAALGSPEGYELEQLLFAIKRYEDEHHPVSKP